MAKGRRGYNGRSGVAAARVIPGGENTVADLSREPGIRDITSRGRAGEHEETSEGAFPSDGSPRAGGDHRIPRLRGRNGGLGGETSLWRISGPSWARTVRGTSLPQGARGLGPVGRACTPAGSRNSDATSSRGAGDPASRRSARRALGITKERGPWAGATTRRRRARGRLEGGDPRTSLVERAPASVSEDGLWVGGVAHVPPGVDIR